MTPTIAIPCIGSATDLMTEMVCTAIEKVYQIMPLSSVVLIGDGSITNISDHLVQTLDACPFDRPVPLRADWIKAQAFRALHQPLWVMDMDIELRRPLPLPSILLALPLHYPLLSGKEYDMPVEWCSTIALWYQAADPFQVFARVFAQDSTDLAGERSACIATLELGGSIVQSPVVVTPEIPDLEPAILKRIRSQPLDPHAFHWASGLKHYRYRANRRRS